MVRMKSDRCRRILLCMFTVLGYLRAQADNAGAPRMRCWSVSPAGCLGLHHHRCGSAPPIPGRDPGVLTMDLETRKITPVACLGRGFIPPVGDTGLVVSTNWR